MGWPGAPVGKTAGGRERGGGPWQPGRGRGLLRAAAAGCAAAAGRAGGAGEGGGALSVLHIIVDDLRPELRSYGAPPERAHTPHIDSLAERGVSFDRAYCQVPLCGPSRSSLLSGRRPDASRAWNMINHFREDHPDWTSLPGLFKAHGGLALGVGKIFHPKMPPGQDGAKSWSSPALPVDDPCPGQGFGCRPCPKEEGRPECVNTSIGSGPINACWCEVGSGGPVDDSLVVEKAERLMDVVAAQPDSGQPFYLAVGLHKPHLPFQATAEDFARFPPAEATQTAVHKTAPEGKPGIAHNTCDSPSPWEPIPDAAAQEARRAYYASAAGTDRHVGQLLAALEARGLGNRTAVVLHADHGWSLGEHGSWRKMSLFETATRVPLVVAPPPGWLPEGRAGGRAPGVAELMDIYPTVAALAGLPPPPAGEAPLAGRSLVPALLQGEGEGEGERGVGGEAGLYLGRVAFSQYMRRPLDPAVPWADNGIVYLDRREFTFAGYSARSEGWRYTEWRRWDGAALQADWGPDGLVGAELYDHRGEDPRAPDFYDSSENLNLLGPGLPDPGPAPRAAAQALAAALRAQFAPARARGPRAPRS